MSRDQNAGQSHSMKIDNRSIERVEEFKYLGTTSTNKNSIQEEIKSRLKSGNVCCHLVQNILSSSLLSKNLKIKIYRTIILPVVVYGCETWSLSLSSSLCNSLHSPVTSSLLGPNTLLNTLFSNTLSLHSSLNVSDQVSHPHRTTGNIIVLYILIFKFWIANWKTKDSAPNNNKHSLTSVSS